MPAHVCRPVNLFPVQGKLHISTDSGADGASPEGSIVDGASPMSLAAGADFADQVCDAWTSSRAGHLHTSQQHVVCRLCGLASCARIFAVFHQHWQCAQELENLKTGGGGEADAPAAAAGLADAASPQQRTDTEFSPQGRVVQLADLPASALPTTESAPPVTAASASVKTISESGHSTQVRHACALSHVRAMGFVQSVLRRCGQVCGCDAVRPFGCRAQSPCHPLAAPWPRAPARSRRSRTARSGRGASRRRAPPAAWAAPRRRPSCPACPAARRPPTRACGEQMPSTRPGNRRPPAAF
jgi:hypothetical protein